MKKALFREKYKELRAQFSDRAIEEMSLQIANKTLELPIWDKTYYHLFLPIVEKKEVNTEYLMHVLQGKDKSIVIPKLNFDTGTLQHILLQENTSLKVSKYGIPEPVSGIEINPQQLEVIFVPLLTYDQTGNRIGYGKGFYDRFLAQCSSKAIFVGLSLFAPEPIITSEATDISLHFCVAPRKLYAF